MLTVKRNVLDELYATAVSVRPFEQWIQKVNFIYQFYAFPYRKRTLPFVQFGCYIVPSLKEFGFKYHVYLIFSINTSILYRTCV